MPKSQLDLGVEICGIMRQNINSSKFLYTVLNKYKNNLRALILYDKKINKIKNDNIQETDLAELETFTVFKQGKEFLEIPERKINDKTILEYLALNDISLWWFAAPIIHPVYREGMLFIDKLNAFLDENSFDILKLNGCFDKLEIIQQLCDKKKIKLEISNSAKFLHDVKQKIKESFKKIGYKKIHNYKTKKRLNVFVKGSKYEQPPHDYVLIVSPTIYRRNSFDPTNKNIEKEYFIQPFLDYCSTNGKPVLCVDVDYTFHGTTEMLKKRLESGTRWIPIEYLLKNEKSERTILQIKTTEKLISDLIDKNPTNVFSYAGISLWSIIKPVINDLLLEPYFPTFLHLLNVIENFLKETKPAIIIQTYEAGPYAKIIELAASKLQIKTIALQHGLISSDTPDYFFNQIRTNTNPLGNIIPDRTLVFGEYYKKLLTEKSAYPPESIDVFGHPEYFDLEQLKPQLNKDKLRTKFNISQKTIILIPLTFRFSIIQNSPDHLLLQLLYDNLKNPSDILILIRPHPSDKLDERLLEKKFPTNNFQISNNSLVEDLSICDLVIAPPLTTVSIEALLFNKPIIFFTTLKNYKSYVDPIFQRMIDNNLAMIVDQSNIVKMINTVIQHNNLSNPDKKEQLINYIIKYNKPQIHKYLVI